MPSDITRFTHSGMSWSDVADAGELNAVLDRGGSERVNLLMHSANLYGAKKALAFGSKQGRKKGLVLDFGCGVARTVRFFGEKGWAVIGTEISSEMLYGARKFGLPKRSLLAVTDGVCIPLRDQSVDMVWVVVC
ncbi:MAG: class I SAM-dependent methyltransferase [Pyrinomonadaceae bacterium]|nr:class I SAM-dependent methyltransferase [Pyrinomonadaceae bacterium]